MRFNYQAPTGTPFYYILFRLQGHKCKNEVQVYKEVPRQHYETVKRAGVSKFTKTREIKVRHFGTKVVGKGTPGVLEFVAQKVSQTMQCGF